MNAPATSRPHTLHASRSRTPCAAPLAPSPHLHRRRSPPGAAQVGFTRACIFPLPEGVLAFFVKPSLMYLYGIDKALVSGTAAAIRAVRKPNAYTGNGIQLVGEALRLKQRAGSK